MGEIENSSFNLGVPPRERKAEIDTSPNNRNHINFIDGGFQQNQPVARLQRGS
jgi:hypothetical protein